MAIKKIELIKGFTLVEVLISLVITAILMTAVAVALNGSIISYRENENIFKSANSARQALNRITTQLRTALADHDAANQSQCTLSLPDGSQVTYHYNSAQHKLLLTSGGKDYVLCDNVTSMTFDKNVVGSDTKSVLISMTVLNGDVQQTLSAAAVIRRLMDK